MQEKLRGIILKTMDYKEKDKLMWVFTEERGKISVLCKGVRAPKNKYQSLIQPMLFGEFLLFKGKTLYSFNEGAVVHSFSSLKGSLELLTYASYYLEMADIVTLDEEVQPYLYRNLVTVMYLLESEALDVVLLTLIYEVKLITLTGFRVGPQAVPFGISKEAMEAAEYILRNEYKKTLERTFSKEVLDELKRITSYLIMENYQRKPKSLSLLKYM